MGISSAANYADTSVLPKRSANIDCSSARKGELWAGDDCDSMLSEYNPVDDDASARSLDP